MTTTELRAHPEYKTCMEKIKNYKPGFTFTLNYNQIPYAKTNALKQICADAIREGYLESVNFMVDFYGHCTAETFRRTGKTDLVPMPGTTDPDWGKKHWGREVDE